MKIALRRFSWGMLWVLLDIRIAGVDVLPDLIGYGLMWHAIRIAAAYQPSIRRSELYAILLGLLSIPDMAAGSLAPGWPVMIHSIPILAYHGSILVFTLLLYDHFLREALPAYTGTRLFMSGVLSVMLILLPFSLNGSESVVTGVSIIAILFTLLAHLLVLIGCRTAAKGG